MTTQGIMSGAMFRLSVLVASLVLAGCATVPAFENPTVELPASFKETTAGNWKIAQPAEHADRGTWWQVFNDATLNSLESQALQANQNVMAATARLAQARAIARATDADRMPQLNAGIGPTRQAVSSVAQGLPAGVGPHTTTVYHAQATISYEIDLFGRLGQASEAAQQDAAAAAAAYRNVLLALQADVAQTYFALRALDAERQLLRETVSLREDAAKLVKRRFDEGDVGELDYARAQTELASTRSEAVALDKRRAELEHALAVLLGKAPTDLAITEAPLLNLLPAIPAGLPSALLERRPDIAAAQRAMAASSARVGAARAAFFPRLSLTGSGGFESTDLGDLFKWSSRTWLLGPIAGALTMPLLDGGRNKANLAYAQASYEEAIARYRQQVLTAFREVDDSLSGLRVLTDQAREQDAAVIGARRVAQLSQTRYREGMVSYLEVVDAQRGALASQRLATQIAGERAATTVALIRALGGGWSANN